MFTKISSALRRNLILLIAGALLASLFLPLTNLFSSPAYAAPQHAGAYNLSPNSDGKVDLSSSDVTIRWVNAELLEITFASAPDQTLIAAPDNESGGDPELDDQRGREQDQKNWTIQGWAPCNGTIFWDDPEDHTAIVSEFKLDIDFRPTEIGDCENTVNNHITITPTDQTNSKAYFRWIDEARIERVDGEIYGEFERSESFPNVFLRVSEASETCQDRLVVSDDKQSARFYELDNSFGGGKPPAEAQSNCDYRDNFDKVPKSNVELPLADFDNSDLEAGTGNASSPDFGTGGDATPTCETGGNPLSYLVCPLINGILRGIDSIFSNFIDPFLRVSPIQDEEGNPIFEIWKNFRTLGNIVLLFALLIAVFGQSIGGGLIDAYTVKKIMPRILVAAILINLSIYLVAFMIDIGNVLGRGIGQIITAPIGDEALFNFKLGGLAEGVIGVGIIATVIGGAVPFLAAVGAAGKTVSPGDATGGAAALAIASGVKTLLLTALMVLFPAFLVVLAVFITLILRQAVIMLLALVSPVALAMWAIPGADKYAKSWAQNLFKAILIYPIVTSIFAISNVLAYVLLNVGLDDTSVGRNAVADLAGLVVLIAPMAMIPFSFKLAGGVLGNVSGFLQGSKGKIDTLVRGDKHNPHSRYYQRRQDGKGGYMTGLAGAIGGKSGQKYQSKKKTSTEALYRRGKAMFGIESEQPDNTKDGDEVPTYSRSGGRRSSVVIPAGRRPAGSDTASDTTGDTTTPAAGDSGSSTSDTTAASTPPADSTLPPPPPSASRPVGGATLPPPPPGGSRPTGSSAPPPPGGSRPGSSTDDRSRAPAWKPPTGPSASSEPPSTSPTPPPPGGARPSATPVVGEVVAPSPAVDSPSSSPDGPDSTPESDPTTTPGYERPDGSQFEE